MPSAPPDPRDSPPSAEELSAATSWQTQFQRRLQWWSFQPITQPDIPEPTSGEHSYHPVDRFIQQKLSAKGLAQSPIADPHTLVRRLYFNLTGLPPSPEEIQHWTTKLEQANSADRQAATEQLIDQLLASPYFGERWARHWMDWIRYAESHGSEGDPPIDSAWIYRDYLIRALNADVPYDQLVREHIAGDLLQQPRINKKLGINESRIGPAHWRMVFHGFAPTDALEERVRFTDDQINAFSKAFLGLTVSCARCHDHKFDPVSQKDYYALYGILNSCRPSRVTIDLPEPSQKIHQSLAALKPKIRQAIATDWLDLSKDLKTKIKAADHSQQLFNPIAEINEAVGKGTSFAEAWQRQQQQWQQRQASISKNTEQYAQRWDLTNSQEYANWFTAGAGLPSEPQPSGTYAVATTDDKAIIGIYPAGIYSHSLSAKDPASLTSNYFQAQPDTELWLQVRGDNLASARYVVQDYPRKGTTHLVKRLDDQWQWHKFNISYWQGDLLHIELVTALDAPLLVEKKDRSWFGIRQAVIRRKDQSAPSAFAEYLQPLFAAAAQQPPQSIDDLVNLYHSAIVTAIKAWQDEKLTDAQALLLDACLHADILPNKISQLSKAQPLLEEYRQIETELSVPTRVHGLAETIARNQRLFDRGNHKNPTEEIPRRFLAAVDDTPYQSTQSGRLQLADDLLRDDTPLTRRVIVNRIWHHLFGQGIVATPDNLGRLGSPPTHPELLDWLASEFKKEGWSIKKLIRRIVTSDTWQQSSQPSSQATQLDPTNQFLSHAHVRRLEAEAIRDALLTSSDLLDRNQFGKSVPGSQPRRSVYVQVIRNSLDPFLRVFDFPEPFTTTGRRDATNVPAQSLTLMNDPAVIQYAASWAEHLLSDSQLDSDNQRIQQMFLTAFGRPATSSEIENAQAYLSEMQQHTQQQSDNQSKSSPELTAYTDLARAIFMMQEFIYVR